MNTFEATVLTFFPPKGRNTVMHTPLPVEVQEHYAEMEAAGCRLEGELLSTGLISCTISSIDDDLDMRVVHNGPEIQTAYVDMLKSAQWRQQLAAEEPS